MPRNWPVGLPAAAAGAAGLGIVGEYLGGAISNLVGEFIGNATPGDEKSEGYLADLLSNIQDVSEVNINNKRPSITFVREREKKRKKMEQDMKEGEVLLNQAKPGGTKVVRPVSSQMFDDCTFAKSLKSFSCGCEIPIIQYTGGVEPTVYSAGSCQSLLCNGIATGTDNNNRVGNRIVMQSLNLRFTPINKSNIGVGSGNPIIGYESFFRLVVVYDKADLQPTNGCPVLTDIFYQTSITAVQPVTGITLSSMYPFNTDNEDRFEILYDKMTNCFGRSMYTDTSNAPVNSINSGISPADLYYNDVVIDLKGRCSRYATNPGGASPNTPSYGGLWVYVFGANGNSSTVQYFFSCARVSCHLRYSDK